MPGRQSAQTNATACSPEVARPLVTKTRHEALSMAGTRPRSSSVSKSRIVPLGGGSLRRYFVLAAVFMLLAAVVCLLFMKTSGAFEKKE